MSTKKVKFSVIDKDAIVDLKISGLFYKRILSLWFHLAKQFEPEQFKDLCEVIKNKEIDKLPNDQAKIEASCIETMVILMNDLENLFKQGGHVGEEELEVPNEDSTS